MTCLRTMARRNNLPCMTISLSGLDSSDAPQRRRPTIDLLTVDGKIVSASFIADDNGDVHLGDGTVINVDALRGGINEHRDIPLTPGNV